MATVTERINLEARAQVTNLRAFEEAKKHLASLLRMQAAFNRQSLKISVAGGTRALDQIEIKIKALSQALAAAGKPQLGAALSGDLNQIGRVVTETTAEIKRLEASLAQLNAAQRTRPGANLGGSIQSTKAQITAQAALLDQAGKLQASLRRTGVGASGLAAAEGALASGSLESSAALSAQTDILAKKQVLFGQVAKAAAHFTAAEEKVAKASTKAASATGAAAAAAREAGEIRQVTRNGDLASRDSATGQLGATLRTTYDEKGEVRDRILTTNRETANRAELAGIRAIAAADKKALATDRDKLVAIRDQIAAAERLGATIVADGRQGTTAYEQTQNVIRGLIAEEKRLELAIARTTAKLRERRIVQGAAGARATYAARAGIAEARAGGDTTARLRAAQEHLASLRKLEAQLQRLGTTGPAEYARIQQAAARAQAQVISLTGRIRDQQRAARESRILAAIGGRQKGITSAREQGRIIAGRDESAKLAAYQQELTALRALEAQLHRMGRAGTDEFREVGLAAAKAQAQVTSLTGKLAASAADARQRERAARAAQLRIDRARTQGFRVLSQADKTNADGTRSRAITLTRDDDTTKQRQTIKALIQMDAAGKPLAATFDRATKSMESFGSRTTWATRNFIDNTKTVVSWAASVAAYTIALRTIRYTTDAVIDLQRKSAVLTAVYQFEREEAVRLKTETLALAVAQGRSASEALDAATRFARLGLTRKQILEVTTVALKAANVAEIDAATAAEQLSSIMAGYRLEANQLYTVLTRLNNVSNQFNTTNKDLLQGVARVGALARESGLGLEELIAIVGTGTGLTGRSGAEFGNAIKSIIVSLSNPEIQTGLKGIFDIDVKTPGGEIKAMDQLLRDLAVTYQHLGQAEKQELLQFVGKKQQASRLAVILGDYTTIQRNLVAALDDGNRTEAENRDIRATLLSQLTSLRTAYEKLAVSTTGAFNEGLGGRFASESIQFLTVLITMLEKVSGILPVVAAAAGLFFFRFVKGALAVDAVSGKAGLLVGTIQRLGKIFTEFTHILAATENKLIAAGGATSQLLAKLHIMTASSNKVVRALGQIGRAAIFTIGSISSLVIQLAVFTAVFKVVEKVNDTYQENQKAAEEARRASLGFSESLNSIMDAAARAGALKDTADFIGQVIASADQESLTRFVNDLIRMSELSTPEATRLRGLAAPGGDRSQLATEVGALRAREAETEVRLAQEGASEAAKSVAAARQEVARLEVELEDLQAAGKQAGQSALKEHIQELKSEVQSFEGIYQDAMERIEKNRTILFDLRVDQESIDRSFAALEAQSGALAEALGGSDPFGKVITENLKRVFAQVGGEGYLSEVTGQFDAEIAKVRDQLANTPANSSAILAPYRQAQTELAGLEDRLARIRRLQEVYGQEVNSGDGWGRIDLGAIREAVDDAREVGVNTANDRTIEADRAATEAALAEKQAYIAAYAEENAEALEVAATRSSLTSQIKEEEKARAATRTTIQRQNALLAEETRRYQELRPRLLEYAARLQQIERIKSDTTAGTEAFGSGRDEAERIRSRITGIQAALRRSLQSQGLYRQVIAAPGDATGTDDRLRQRLQDEQIRAGVLANQLEAQRNALIGRAAAIEREILDARVRQNEETSKALGLASREEQLRAAFLARFQAGNGGGKLTENQFQFLDQQTRAAVNSFTPGLAPVSQGSDLDRLNRERDRINSDLAAVITSLERTIAAYQQAQVDNVPAFAGGNSTLLGPGQNPVNSGVIPGTTPVNITIGAGAIQIDLAEPFGRLATDLTRSVETLIDTELATLRADLAATLAPLRTAAARGGR